MENTLELTGVYNEEEKALFLEEYENLNTKRAYVRIFRNTYEMEDRLEKDLYLFTREELEEFFENTSPSTNISARNYGRMIVQYLQWAVDNKKIERHPFPVQQHFFLKYVKREEDEFMDIKELKYYTQMYFKNAQDGIILELLFFGVQGKEGNELLNISMDDLDDENHTIKLHDEVTGRRRTLQLEDNKLINFCRQANKETKYYKRNGEIEENPRIRPYTDLIDSPFILKNSNTNMVYKTKATKYTIYNRLKNIKKFEEVVPVAHKISIKNIVKSGQLYMASKLYERDGKLELPQLREIYAHFGVKEHWSLRDYLNEENLFKLYPHLKNKQSK